MKENDVSACRPGEKCGIDGRTIRRLPANDSMEAEMPNQLCAAPDCWPEDVAEQAPAI